MSYLENNRSLTLAYQHIKYVHAVEHIQTNILSCMSFIIAESFVYATSSSSSCGGDSCLQLDSLTFFSEFFLVTKVLSYIFLFYICLLKSKKAFHAKQTTPFYTLVFIFLFPRFSLQFHKENLLNFFIFSYKRQNKSRNVFCSGSERTNNSGVYLTYVFPI